MNRTDEKIKREIVDQLYWDTRVNAAEIKVEVEDGEVTLTGSVDTIASRSAATSDAWMINGVTDVHNSLRVDYGSGVTLPSDIQIRSRVEDALMWNSYIDSNDIKVDVMKGRVDLKGSVESFWKKSEAERIASAIYGVNNVENLLAIVPTDSFIDKDIATDIQQAMQRNIYISADDVLVEVVRGVVILSGDVSSQYSRSQAENIAMYTAGVTDVINNLRIRTPVIV